MYMYVYIYIYTCMYIYICKNVYTYFSRLGPTDSDLLGQYRFPGVPLKSRIMTYRNLPSVDSILRCT